MSVRPIPSSIGVSGRMARQRRAGTGPEMALRRELHSAGLRYRVGWPTPGAPRRSIDIAFTRHRLAVFVDGCFWHGCPEHRTWPKANGAWWQEKIAQNTRRDLETTALLEAAGWTVLRVWEHESTSAATSKVMTALLASAQLNAHGEEPRAMADSPAQRPPEALPASQGSGPQGTT